MQDLSAIATRFNLSPEKIKRLGSISEYANHLVNRIGETESPSKDKSQMAIPKPIPPHWVPPQRELPKPNPRPGEQETKPKPRPRPGPKPEIKPQIKPPVRVGRVWKNDKNRRWKRDHPGKGISAKEALVGNRKDLA